MPPNCPVEKTGQFKCLKLANHTIKMNPVGGPMKFTSPGFLVLSSKIPPTPL